MGGDCYTKHKEKGLWFELQEIEKVVKSKMSKGEDCSFEKSLLRSYKKYSERDYEKQSSP